MQRGWLCQQQVRKQQKNSIGVLEESTDHSLHKLLELNSLDALQQGTVGKDLTRYHSWLDIVRANTFMGLGEYKEAINRAEAALISSRDINSTTNITNIVDIYGRLLDSPCDTSDVQELEDMIRETGTNHFKKE
jgi:hypothetical protein